MWPVIWLLVNFTNTVQKLWAPVLVSEIRGFWLDVTDYLITPSVWSSHTTTNKMKRKIMGPKWRHGLHRLYTVDGYCSRHMHRRCRATFGLCNMAVCASAERHRETLQQPEIMKRSRRKLAGFQVGPVLLLLYQRWCGGLARAYRPGGSEYPRWCKWTVAVRSGQCCAYKGALGHRRGFLSLRAQLALCSWHDSVRNNWISLLILSICNLE